MSQQFNRRGLEHESATFYVSSTAGRLAKDNSSPRWNAGEDFERALDEYCEPPVQCYRFLGTGEVTSVFTDINSDGTATNKRRRVSLPQHELSAVQKSITRHGYGVEFVLKRPSEVIERLQSDSDQQRHVRASPGIARTRSRRFRMGRKRRALFRRKNDKELLRERIESHRSCLYNLASPLGENPYIRCEHWYHDGRAFAFASANIRKGASRKAVVALLWHTRTRPHRAVCVTFSLKRDSSREEGDNMCFLLAVRVVIS